MTITNDVALGAGEVKRSQIEALLYCEARLLEEWRFDEWSALDTEDTQYIIPTYNLPVPTRNRTCSS